VEYSGHCGIFGAFFVGVGGFSVRGDTQKHPPLRPNFSTGASIAHQRQEVELREAIQTSMSDRSQPDAIFGKLAHLGKIPSLTSS
jgi:hypothetical protein